MKKLFIAFAFILIFTPVIYFPLTRIVHAGVGVGISPGIIRVDQSLMPGGHYQLPVMQVLNTGDESLQYEVALSPMDQQVLLQPEENFISLVPNTFYLDPGENQIVVLSLDIPVRAEPGDYLAYIEARPTFQGQGGTSIGVAAATKLYFSVSPSSTWAGIVNSMFSFFKRNAPTSYIIPGVVIFCYLIYIGSRRLKVVFKLTRR